MVLQRSLEEEIYVWLIRVRNKLKLRPTIPQGSRDLVELFDCQESLHMLQILSQYCLSLQQLLRPS